MLHCYHGDKETISINTMLIYNQVQILLLGYVYSCIHAGRIIEINKNTKRNVWIVPI